LRWNSLARFFPEAAPLEQPSQIDLNALSISERLAAFCASQAGDKRELCQSSIKQYVADLESFFWESFKKIFLVRGGSI
jgi:hypothetical protein